MAVAQLLVVRPLHTHMKTSHIGMILASALLVGCASSSPKDTKTATISPAAAYFNATDLAKLNQICLSLEAGLACSNRFDFQTPAVVVVVLQPARVVSTAPSPFDVPHRDMSLIDDTK